MNVSCNFWTVLICDTHSSIIHDFWENFFSQNITDWSRHAQRCSLYMAYVTNAHVWSKWINEGLKTVPSPPHQHSLVLLTCATSCHFTHQAGQPFALARSHFHHFTLHACFLSHFLIESTLRQLGVGMDGNTHQQSPWKQSWGNKGT